jgi:hypothetical protein
MARLRPDTIRAIFFSAPSGGTPAGDRNRRWSAFRTRHVAKRAGLRHTDDDQFAP